MLQRKPMQARYQFEIPGITREVCFSDYIINNNGDEVDDEGGFRLDRAQFASMSSDMTDLDSGEQNQGYDRLEMLSLRSGNLDELDASEFELESVEHQCSRIDKLQAAIQSLTDQQTIAIWLWANGWSERMASERMSISQPTYHGILFGKKGVGGAIRKISKYFQKHPIT